MTPTDRAKAAAERIVKTGALHTYECANGSLPALPDVSCWCGPDAQAILQQGFEAAIGEAVAERDVAWTAALGYETDEGLSYNTPSYAAQFARECKEELAEEDQQIAELTEARDFAEAKLQEKCMELDQHCETCPRAVEAQQRIRELEAGLRTSMETFRKYEDIHRRKAPIGVCALPEFGELLPTCTHCGASRTMHEFVAKALGKADTNARLAEMCEKVLNDGGR